MSHCSSMITQKASAMSDLASTLSQEVPILDTGAKAENRTHRLGRHLLNSTRWRAEARRYRVPAPLAPLQIILLAIPADRPLQGGFNRAGLEAQFNFGLGAIHEHLVARHAYAFQGNAGLPPEQTRCETIGIGGRQRQSQGQADSRARSPADGRENVKDFLEPHVAAAKDVSLSDTAAFGSQPVSYGHALHRDQVKPGFNVSRHPAVEKVQDDAPGGR